MDLLGLIPARGGSRGIPRKNLALLSGRPLLAYTCAAAVGSARLTRIIVSTDSEEIAELARELGIEVPFLRPAELAGDATPMIEVIGHALDVLGDPDAIVLLQPTSPLRRAEHIDEAVDRWLETGADSIVSVVRVPHAFVPDSLLRLERDCVVPYVDARGATRRQGKPALYARNGPAVLVTRPEVIRSGSLYGADTRPYVMAPEASVDVDTPADLELAECLLERLRSAGVV